MQESVEKPPTITERTPPLTSHDAADGLPAGRRGSAMLVILLGLTVVVLDSSLLNLALPAIARAFQADAPHTIWVVNAYQIATLVMLLPLAAVGERIGYRSVYLWGMALFALASLGAIFAPSLGALIAARALQGLGAAGVLSVNAALVRFIFPRAQLGRGLALNSAVVASASVAGPTVAAAILSAGSWPWLLAPNVPLGLLTLWLGRKSLPETPRVASANGERAFSALDLVLNMAMFALVFLGADALGVARKDQPGSMLVGGLMLGTGLLIGAWHLVRQSRRPRPLFPVDLFRIPVFALSMASSVNAFCAQTLAFLSLPFLLLETYGRSALQAGLLLTAWPLAIVTVAPLAGWLIGRYPDGLLGGLGMAVFASGLWLLALLPAQPSDLDVIWRMALCGAGFALFQSPNNHTIVRSTPVLRSGAGSAMLGTARLTGQTMGAVILAALFALWPGHGGLAETVALVGAGGFAAVAGVCSSLRIRQPRA